jgi:hypothetical protein
MSPTEQNEQGGWRAMGYRLGVDLGTTFTAAVIHRPGSAPTVVPLGDRAATIPSVVFLGEDGTTLVGEAAERRALTDPSRVVRRFKRRIGDETPLLVGAGGDGLPAHAIAARMIALVADRVAEQEGSAPDAIAVTVPAAWGAHKKELLAGALVREGLLGVGLISEPTAAALAYADTGRLGAGTTVAVYDFGGGTFDAALLRSESGGRFTPLGTPSGLPDLGGIDFDDAVLAYVLGTVGPQTPGVDLDDPVHVTAMARLRRECVDAKEALSADTAATVPVMLGGIQTSVRLTRGEFEAMIAAAVEETCVAVEAALVSAGLTRNGLDRILLVGGSSRIPLVTQLLSARYPGVVLDRDIDPKFAVAIGGVLALDASGSGLPAGPAMPERPSRELEAFDRAPGVPLVRQRKKRKTPIVLAVVAGLIMTSSVSLSALGHLKFDGGLPSAQLQEAKAGAADENRVQLQEEALHEGKTQQGDEGSAAADESGSESASSSSSSSSSSSESSSTSSESSESGSAGSSSARGRTEGSATSPSDPQTSDASTADQASAKRAAAKKSTASGQTTARSDATQAAAPTEPASSTAPVTAPAQPAATTTAPAETSDTDSGSIEAFNDGATTDAPPSGN